MIGTREISGSPAIRFKNVTMAFWRIEHALVHVDVDHLGAGFHLLQGDFEGFGVVVFTDQPGELGRTGDVGALADVDKQRVAVDGERLKPDRRQALGISGMARGLYLATASAMAWICAGVVPQQPPTMFRKPLAANSSTTTAISSGVSSYSPKAFGRPALGCADTWVLALATNSSRYGRSSLAPRAQFRPTENGLGVADGVPEGLGGLARTACGRMRR